MLKGPKLFIKKTQNYLQNTELFTKDTELFIRNTQLFIKNTELSIKTTDHLCQTCHTRHRISHIARARPTRPIDKSTDDPPVHQKQNYVDSA